MDTKVIELLERLLRVAESMDARLPKALTAPDWSASIAYLYRKRHGNAQLEPVKNIQLIALEQLCQVDIQKQKIWENTEQFVKGALANNVLLTGARGTGKSSLVKACLNDFAAAGLRLIEIDKDDLVDLPDIINLVTDRPERFIIFCDDLSFDDGEPGYKALKSVLDGSVAGTATNSNVLIYATSNRRHLLPEYVKENLQYQHQENGEVHPGEGTEEKISLSERFGLWVSFYPFSQQDYLAIVDQWLLNLGLSQDDAAKSHPEALIWALERGSRSGRVAFQFAKDYCGRIALHRSAKRP